MRWDRWLNPGWLNALELEELDARIDRMRVEHRGERVRKLRKAERDVARLALVVRSFAELAIAKGLITKAELLAQIERTDLADGVADGELDAESVVPETPVARKGAPRTKASPEALARARERVDGARATRRATAPIQNSELVTRARKRLEAAREKDRNEAAEHPTPPPPSNTELVSRAKAKLKAAKEKERRKNLP